MLLQWTALWVSLCAVSPRLAAAEADGPDWNEIFTNRNDDDWARVWHVERHRRCYHELLSHMNWVCEKDIYKMRRRKRDAPSLEKDADLADVFLKPETALSLLSSSSGKQSGPGNRRKSLRRQRLGVRGIMDECCDVQAGCSWEEYAEYCPTSRRIRN